MSLAVMMLLALGGQTGLGGFLASRGLGMASGDFCLGGRLSIWRRTLVLKGEGRLTWLDDSVKDSTALWFLRFLDSVAAAGD